MSNIVEKIQKLLNLSKNEGATENERAVALKMANGFMDKYNISRIDAKNFSDDPRGTSEIPIGAAPWRSAVFAAIGKLYGAKVWRTKGAGGMAFILATESTRDVVIVMGEYAIDSIELEARTLLQDGGGKRATSSFRNGAASGLFSQVNDILEEREKGSIEVSQEKGLVLKSFYLQEAYKNKTWFKENLGFQLSKAAPRRISDGEAYGRGMSHGKNISLNSQLTGKSAPRLPA